MPQAAESFQLTPTDLFFWGGGAEGLRGGTVHCYYSAKCFLQLIRGITDVASSRKVPNLAQTWNDFHYTSIFNSIIGWAGHFCLFCLCGIGPCVQMRYSFLILASYFAMVVCYCIAENKLMIKMEHLNLSTV